MLFLEGAINGNPWDGTTFTMFEHIPHRDKDRLSPDDFAHHSCETIPETAL